MTTLGSGYQYYLGYVSSAGTFATGLVVGGLLDSSTVIDGTTVDAGGQLNVGGGGTATDTVVNSNGNGGFGFQLSVGQGGTAIDTVVNSGGFAFVADGGVIASTAVNGFLGLAGSASGTTVNSGGQFENGGIATNTVINGGFEGLADGGTAIGTTINSGGTLDFQHGNDNVETGPTVLSVCPGRS